MKYVVHTDGGARGNPGPAAVGVVIEKVHEGDPSTRSARSGRAIEIARRIGEATNNVAEYTAVIEALHKLKNENLKMKNEDEKTEVQFYLDSTLVVNQLNGLFKVKDAKLRQLLTAIRILEGEVGGVVQYHYVPREQNRRADFLVNYALDR